MHQYHHNKFLVCVTSYLAIKLFLILILNLSHAGLKSMVVQGVKNPLVDLLSLEDKTLDEVRCGEMISVSQPHHTT